MGPAMTAEDSGSMPGSFESRGEYMRRSAEDGEVDEQEEDDDQDSDGELDRNDSFDDDDAIFDDDILATGEMKNVPF